MKTTNHDLLPALPLNPWRKLAIATFNRAPIPLAYAAREIDVTRALDVAAKEGSAAGVKVSLLCVVASAIARVLAADPGLNVVFRRGRAQPVRGVRLMVQVSLGRERLSNATLEAVEGKTPTAIARDLEEAVTRVRAGANAYESRMAGALALPTPVIGRILGALGALFVEGNVSPQLLGLDHGPFGSWCLNNVGSLGIDDVIGPWIPWMRSPGTFLMTRVRRRPTVVVVDGVERVEIRSILKVWVAADHRLFDGAHAPAALDGVERLLCAPEALWSAP